MAANSWPMSWSIPILVFWRPYWLSSWIVTFSSYCHHEGSIPWPWKYINRLLICLYIWLMSWDMIILVFWWPYWSPSWKVTFPSYCHYERSITWPWKYLTRLLICLCSWPMSSDMRILVLWWTYWWPSWKVTFPSYCHYEGSIPWPWRYLNRLLICLCNWPMSSDKHILVF